MTQTLMGRGGSVSSTTKFASHVQLDSCSNLLHQPNSWKHDGCLRHTCLSRPRHRLL